jgi:glycosyltransferase involved in cell wall biosynthesis
MIKNQLPKILMVSTEYPPMRGGVGRYTYNLVRQLRKKGLNVLVASNEEGDGDFFGLAPANNENYRVLLKIVDEIQPDIVHIQESTSSECNDMIANIDVEIMDFAIIFVRIFFSLNQIHVIVLQLDLWLNMKKRKL